MKSAGRSRWLKWIGITLLLNVVLWGSGWLLFRAVVIYVYTYEPTFRIAEYDGFYAALAVDGDRVVEIAAGTDRTGSVLPQMFIRKGDTAAVLLSVLPEEWVADLAGEQRREKSISPNGVLYRFPGVFYSRFEFSNGQLINMIIQTNELPIQVGPTSEGPFVSLPIPVEEFLAIFGKPKKWTKGRHGRPAGLP